MSLRANKPGDGNTVHMQGRLATEAIQIDRVARHRHSANMSNGPSFRRYRLSASTRARHRDVRCAATILLR
ncbi:hypothetical protein CC2G_008088 [Coprinopsis cinerea AmutBmut pab1-1]|nr:hypothetical protein CC2G_008088 [Coprinopsis cinerea AmutBmut pab1-1]